jgi:hypothetical protein
MPQTSILILTANPQGTNNRLEQEVRDITEGLQRAAHRETFNLQSRWAVRPRDVQRALLDLNPQIVHFSGHGLGKPTPEPDGISRKLIPVASQSTHSEGLAFEDNNGNTTLASTEALANLFALFKGSVQCVVLNACYSANQAAAIAQHIPYVIGMSRSIGDKAAIEFAVSFYDALGAGRDVPFAYKLAKNAIQLSGIPEHLTPVLEIAPKPTAVDSLIQPVPSAPRRRQDLEQQKDNRQAERELLGGKAKRLLLENRKFVGAGVALWVMVGGGIYWWRSQQSASRPSDKLPLISKTSGIDYTPLLNLLVAKKWEEADVKTDAMMIQAVRKSTDSLTDEDMNTFPCEDLRLIDQLWQSQSNGKFGFSVQGQLYQSMGGTESYKKAVWDAVGSKVGWVKDGTWLKYDELVWNSNAPKGHLPLPGVGPQGKVDAWGSVFLRCGLSHPKPLK